MKIEYKFNRLEFAGSLGDLGTLLPLAIGMILINGLNPSGLFLAVGLFYILSGVYYGIPVPVQPMKVIGAYAIATAMSGQQVMASGLIMGVLLLIICNKGIMAFISRHVLKPVIRGVQLSTGVLLLSGGIKFITGVSGIQEVAEPYLTIQNLGPIPIGIIIGIIGGILTLFLLDNKRFPAGLVIVAAGVIIGGLTGTYEGFDKLKLGIYVPEIIHLDILKQVDLTFVLLALVFPQLPMTIGNAVIANADLSKEYFGEAAKKVTLRSLCVSMGLANIFSFILGGMPMCHGAGGLAAHYRFGARTGGSNVIIGMIFIVLAVFLGPHILAVICLIPMSVLGVLLVFAGGQLALTIMDIKERKDYFIMLMILGITLASNLAVGFIAGIIIERVLRSDRLSV